MRQTQKYLAGITRLRQLEGKPTGRPKRYENAELYQLLESKKQIWDSKQGEWIEGTKSMFGDDESTGIVRIRVMAHPLDVDNAVLLVQKQKRLQVVEVSDKYPNRRGPGVRVYLTCVLGGKS